MPPTKSLLRIVIDTNLIIAGRFKSRSASNRIIDLCLEKRLQGVYSNRIKKENIRILERVRPSERYMKKIWRYYTVSILFDPTRRVDICFDKEDNKFLECAIAADAIVISSDRHLLENDGYMGIRVVKPSEFMRSFMDKDDDL